MKWFSVEKDGLPEKGRQCLVYMPNVKYNEFDLDYWNDFYGWVKNCCGDITHWYYLEEPGY